MYVLVQNRSSYSQCCADEAAVAMCASYKRWLSRQHPSSIVIVCFCSRSIQKHVRAPVQMFDHSQISELAWQKLSEPQLYLQLQR